MKKAIVMAAALVAMAACNKNIIETPETEYGYINFGITADTDMVVSKAGEVYENYLVSLYKVEGESRTPVWENKVFKDIDAENDWKVVRGDYAVYVENKAKAETVPADSKGEVWVSGEGTCTVMAGLPSDCPVACEPTNTVVTISYTDDFVEVFGTSVETKVAQADGSREFTMTAGHDQAANGVFYLVDEETGKAALKWTMETALNENTYSKSFDSQRGKWTQITFTTASTDGAIKVTITVDGEITDEDVITIDETIDPLEGNN